MNRAAAQRAAHPAGSAVVVAAAAARGMRCRTPLDPEASAPSSSWMRHASPSSEMTSRSSVRSARSTSRIDRCHRDAATSSAELQSFINGAPDGSTIVFKAGGTYRLDSALVISGRRNLTLEGSGARLNLTGHVGRVRIDRHPGPGRQHGHDDPQLHDGRQRQRGRHERGLLQPRGAARHRGPLRGNTLIEDMDIRRVWGDCVYVSSESATGGWSDGVTFRNSTCTLTGRHGVGLIAGKNVRIERNVFDQIGYMIVDIEPNDSSGGASDVARRGQHHRLLWPDRPVRRRGARGRRAQ